MNYQSNGYDDQRSPLTLNRSKSKKRNSTSKLSQTVRLSSPTKSQSSPVLQSLPSTNSLSSRRSSQILESQTQKSSQSSQIGESSQGPSTSKSTESLVISPESSQTSLQHSSSQKKNVTFSDQTPEVSDKTIKNDFPAYALKPSRASRLAQFLRRSVSEKNADKKLRKRIFFLSFFSSFFTFLTNNNKI
mgnify:CR=1 FL=1